MTRTPRCLAKAAQDLTAKAQAAALQRLQSTLLGSPAGAGGGGSSSSSVAAGHRQQQQPQQQEQQRSRPPALLQQLSRGFHRQQQQQQQQLASPWAWQQPWPPGAAAAWRGYARSAPGLRPRPASSRHGSGSDHYNQQQQQQQQQQQLSLSPSYQPGRAASNCMPTQQLREPYDATTYDEWQDRDQLKAYPIQVDGSRLDDLEEPMLLKQQLEGSSLPNVIKRTAYMGDGAWEEVLLDVGRSVKVTKGGKVETLHALVVVGNRDGLIGVGQHSGSNIQKVTLDAQLKAYKALVPIPRYRGHTIYHPIDLKSRKIRLQAWPRQLGFGITASPLITELCDLAGINNVTVKLTGRRKNKRAVVAAFLEAFGGQSLPHDGVEGSGVYVREVYPWKRLPAGLQRGVDVP